MGGTKVRFPTFSSLWPLLAGPRVVFGVLVFSVLSAVSAVYLLRSSFSSATVPPFGFALGRL